MDLHFLVADYFCQPRLTQEFALPAVFKLILQSEKGQMIHLYVLIFAETSLMTLK